MLDSAVAPAHHRSAIGHNLFRSCPTGWCRTVPLIAWPPSIFW